MTLQQKLEAARKREFAQRREALELREKLPGLEGEAQAEAVAKLHEVERRALDTAEEIADLQSSVSNDPQSREGAVLETRAFGQDYLVRVIEARHDGRPLDGAIRELHEERGLPIGYASIYSFGEQRAVTPAPANVQVQQPREPAIPVAHGGDAQYLFVVPDILQQDLASYAALTTKAAVKGPFTDSTEVEETTGSFTVSQLAPGRLQASFLVRKSDLFGFAAMGPTLDRGLRAGLTEEWDAYIVSTISTDVADTAAAGADTFASIASRFIHGAVDGTYARQATDVRLLIGSATYADWAGLSNATTQETGVELAARLSGGLRVSPNVPAATDTASKQLTVARLGSRREDFAAAIWEGVEILRDPYSHADTGEVEFVATMFVAAKTIRTAAFRQVQAQFK